MQTNAKSRKQGSEKGESSKRFTYTTQRGGYISIVGTLLFMMIIEGGVIILLIAIFISNELIKLALFGIMGLLVLLMVGRVLAPLWTSHHVNMKHLQLRYGFDFKADIPRSAIIAAQPVQEKLGVIPTVRYEAAKQRIMAAFSDKGQVLLRLDQSYPFRVGLFGTRSSDQVLINVDKRDEFLDALDVQKVSGTSSRAQDGMRASSDGKGSTKEKVSGEKVGSVGVSLDVEERAAAGYPHLPTPAGDHKGPPHSSQPPSPLRIIEAGEQEGNKAGPTQSQPPSPLRIIEAGEQEGNKAGLNQSQPPSPLRIRGGSVDSRVAIRTEGLTRRYGNLVAVDKLDLSIHQGEIYGFLGANGAGKTTTMKMLVGLLEPDAGRAEIGGYDIWNNPLAAKAVLGYVADRAMLYDRLTGREFLMFLAQMRGIARQQAEGDIDHLLNMLELSDRAQSQCATYSYGMKRKLALAAALLHHPSVLILDEPLNGLDPLSARRLKDLFAELAADGTAIFLSTHDLATAESLCHRVGIISRGRLLVEGSADELREIAAAPDLESIFLALMAGEAEVSV